MNRRTSFALAAVALMLSASLAMAQGSTPTTTASKAKPAKPAAGAVAAAKTAAATAASSAPSPAAKTAAAATPARTAAAAAQAKSAAAASAGALVDLNTASKADLMKLPGIGEAISAKIIAGRPWTNKAQLLSKGLVGKAAYDKLSALVIAKQAK